jgi:hypothetical protein
MILERIGFCVFENLMRDTLKKEIWSSHISLLDDDHQLKLEEVADIYT